MPRRIHSTRAERQKAYRQCQRTTQAARDWAVEVHRPPEWFLLVDQLPEAREVATGVTANLGTRARAFQLGKLLLVP